MADGSGTITEQLIGVESSVTQQCYKKAATPERNRPPSHYNKVLENETKKKKNEGTVSTALGTSFYNYLYVERLTVVTTGLN